MHQHPLQLLGRDFTAVSALATVRTELCGVAVVGFYCVPTKHCTACSCSLTQFIFHQLSHDKEAKPHSSAKASLLTELPLSMQTVGRRGTAVRGLGHCEFLGKGQCFSVKWKRIIFRSSQYYYCLSDSNGAFLSRLICPCPRSPAIERNLLNSNATMA